MLPASTPRSSSEAGVLQERDAMTRRGHGVWLVAVAVAGTSAWACGSAAKNDVQGSRPAILAATATAYLPEDVLLAVAAASPRRLAGALDWPTLVAKHDVLSTLAAESRSELGHDLLTLAGWTEIGIDVDRSFGFALLGDGPDGIALFAGVADAGKLRAFITARAADNGDAVNEATADATSLLTFEKEPDLAFVLRGEHVLMVASEWAKSYASRMVRIDLADSLAGHEPFLQAVGGLGGGADVAGYADVRPVLARAWGPRASEAMGAVAFGADLLPQAVNLEIHAATAPGTLLTRLLRDRRNASMPAVLRATNSQPLIVGNVLVDPAAALAVVGDVAGADTLDELRGLARQMFGLDVDKELIPLFSGDVGFALTSAALHLDEMAPSDWGVHVVLGATDGRKLGALVDRLRGHPLLAQILRQQAVGTYEIPVPGWRSLYLGVVGDWLAVSTEAAFLTRLGGDGSESFVHGLGQDGLAAVLSRPGATAIGAMQTGVMGWLLVASRASRKREAMASDGPASAEEEARRAELAALQERSDALEARLAAAQKGGVAVMQSWGTTAFHVRVVDGGLVATGGQFLAGVSLAGALDASIGLWARIRALDQEREEIERRRWEIEGELERLRSGVLVPVPAPPLP
jgi:hypothetical protein